MSERNRVNLFRETKRGFGLGRFAPKCGRIQLDVVEACINLMEDSPLFNAGKGVVFTAAGENEMDASIMDGSDWRAGAIAGVKNN